MDKYIGLEAAMMTACKALCHPGVFCPDWYCKEVRDAFNAVPAADVRPVKRGKWHDCYHQLMPNCYVAVCSSCGEKHEYIGGGYLKFCPNCGADMGEG